MADREYVGAIHVHTTFSDGHSSPMEVIAAAAEAGLDYVVISDHNSDRCYTEGLTGRRGRVLCVSAPEVGLRGQPHFLAFGLDDFGAIFNMLPAEALETAAKCGAKNFIAHPFPAQMPLNPRRPVGWEYWDTDAFCGLELWSYMHDVCDRLYPWHVFKLARSHEKLVHGPSPRTLKRYDDLCLRRRVAAIGGLDNHAQQVPVLGPILPHLDLFRLMRTHVLCGELPADDWLAEEALIAALADGSSFIALDGWGDATGFRLEVAGRDETLGLGQEATFASGCKLLVKSPRAAELRLLRDGRVLAERQKATALELVVETPGVYRVEALLNGRPWVFTNPIYLRAEHGSASDPLEG